MSDIHGRFRLTALATVLATVASMACAQSTVPDGTSVGTTQLCGIQQLMAYSLEGGRAGFQAVNPSTNALGAFQMTPIALRDMGVIDAGGHYLPNQFGITSQSDFLNSPDKQIALDNAYNTKNLGYLQRAMGGNVPATSPTGVPLNQAAQIYCAESLGAGGCATYLRTGQISQQVLDANPPYRNGGYASRLGTASAAQDGQCGANDGGPAGVPHGIVAAVEGLYCNPEVAQMLVQSGTAYVNQQMAIATNPNTGFTMLGGASIADFAGLGSGSSSLGASNGFRGLSCLDNLLNGGLNIIFEPPNLSAILSQLAGALCTKASSLMAQLVQPLQSGIGQTANLGGFMPGLGLGSLLGGVNVQQSSTPGISFGIANGSADTSWYSTGSVGSFAGLPSGGGNVSLLNGLFGDTTAAGNGAVGQNAIGRGIFGN